MSYTPVATGITDVADVLINTPGKKTGRVTYYLKNGQLYGLGVNKNYSPYQFDLGGLGKAIYSRDYRLFYGLMRICDFMIYSEESAAENFFNSFSKELVK